MTDFAKYITVNPGVCHGQACFTGTRILVYLILEMLEDGETTQDIIKAYPALTRNHIQAALHYAAEVIKTGEFIPFAQPA
jgi:uncharacterized protein (DUF433 family)